MRKNLFIAGFIVICFCLALIPMVKADAASLADKVSGKILIQVQDNGEAWYVYPKTQERYYLGRPSDAFNVMRQLGLGINNKDFNSFNGVAPKRLSGMILINVDDLGKAYYVNPVDLKMNYLGTPSDAFNVMRQLGLGITDDNLNQIKVAANSTTPPNGQPLAGMPNPASVFCKDSGGQLQILKNDNGSEYGVCVFTDNYQCEEWAMFHGYCPVGGLRVTGYDNAAQVYCAIIGGSVNMQADTCSFSNGAICNIEKLYNDECNEHFNEPATSWEYAQYKLPPMLIGYLSNTMYVVNATNTVDSINEKMKKGLIPLTITIQKVSNLPTDQTLGYDKATAEKDEVSLSKGQYGANVDFALASSTQVVKVDNKVNGKEFVVLSRFEVCDITFERILIFYYNGYQVMLNLKGDKDKIIAENPSYFLMDGPDCKGSGPEWNYVKSQNIQNEFYQAGMAGTLKGEATGSWFYTWDEVVDAIVLAS